MTPQEFFNRIIGDNSKYVTAQYVKEVISKNNSIMLNYFIEDVKILCDKWEIDERLRLEEQTRKEFEEKVEWLNTLFRYDGMSQEDYNYNLPVEPDYSNLSYPTLPDNVIWAMEELKKGLASPTPQPDTSTPVITDLVIDTSTGATGQAPEGWRLPREVDNLQAQGYFAELVRWEFMEIVEGKYNWKGTKKELALCAELMSENLGFKNKKWKIFQDLFGVINLAQERYKAIEINGKYSNRENELRKIFMK